MPNSARLRNWIKKLSPDYIHVATEGPIGWLTRWSCRREGRPFTTSYHTKLPEYVYAYAGVPVSWGYALARRFHNSSCGTMVATPSLANELRLRGFQHLLPWTRGVDTAVFRPRDDRLFGNDEPVFLYVGRIAREKNIAAFLDLELPGKKWSSATGRISQPCRRKYQDVIFTGAKFGEELARHYASADVFVFPSKSDTFGLVLLEAMSERRARRGVSCDRPHRSRSRRAEPVLSTTTLPLLRPARCRSISREGTRPRTRPSARSNAAEQFLAKL